MRDVKGGDEVLAACFNVSKRTIYRIRKNEGEVVVASSFDKVAKVNRVVVY